MIGSKVKEVLRERGIFSGGVALGRVCYLSSSHCILLHCGIFSWNTKTVFKINFTLNNIKDNFFKNLRSLFRC